jgi:hypothetical protein
MDPHTHHSQQLTWTVLGIGHICLDRYLPKISGTSTTLGLPFSNM